MKYALALVAAAGIAASANAQNTKLVFEAMVNNGPWTMGSVDAAPGDTVKVRLSVQLINTTRTTVGFSGITLQPTVTGWTGQDTLLPFDPVPVDDGDANTKADSGGGGVAAGLNGRYLPFNTGAPMTAVSPSGVLSSFTDIANTLRFAGSLSTTAGNLTRGVGLAQQTSALLGGTDVTFVTGPSASLFQYAFAVGATRSLGDQLVASAPLDRINLARGSWYGSTGGTGSPFNAAVLANDIMGVTINIVPSASSLALLGLGGLVAGRRRR